MLKRFVLILCLVRAATISAQVDTSLIVGTLQDATGATIPSASVTITDQATNAVLVLHTNAEGNYTSPPLRVGTYTVMVEAVGFQSQTRVGITLQVQDRRRVDFTMSVGQVSQNVTVTDQTPAIQTDKSSLGQVIESKTMTDLPLNGRDYLQLATLSTGVIATSTGTNGNTGGASTGGQNSFVANGARGTLNNFLLDGIDNNSNDTGGLILRTSVDAIQEFKIQTNSFSAEFGRSGGAAINAVIKSGSNAYHGDVFEFFRNSALDARNYFEDPTAKKASFLTYPPCRMLLSVGVTFRVRETQSPMTLRRKTRSPIHVLPLLTTSSPAESTRLRNRSSICTLCPISPGSSRTTMSSRRSRMTALIKEIFAGTTTSRKVISHSYAGR